MTKSKQPIDIDAEFDDLDKDFFDEKKIKLRTASLLLKENPNWLEKQAAGQKRRKETDWSKKMFGNKNGLNGRARSGMTNSEESNKKRSQTLMGIERHNLRGVPKPKETCPHCGKVGGRPQMLQFHFDRCKFKKD